MAHLTGFYPIRSGYFLLAPVDYELNCHPYLNGM